MPSYLGDAHQVWTSFICCSYKASSAAPALSLSGNSWKESDGKAVDMGLFRDGRADILVSEVESGRIEDEVILAAGTARRGREVAIRLSMTVCEALFVGYQEDLWDTSA